MEDKNLKVISDQVADPASPLAGSTMTKAGRLAMELSQEKKRLKQELEELQTEYDEIKPTTPTGTRDWYVKWVASILILVSLAMRSAGIDYRMYDLTFGLAGIILWTWVSIIWRDRALIMLNAISGFMLATTILREL